MNLKYLLSRRIFWSLFLGGVAFVALALVIIANNQATNRTPWIHSVLWTGIWVFWIGLLPAASALRAKDAGRSWFTGLTFPFSPLAILLCLFAIVNIQIGGPTVDPSSGSYVTVLYVTAGVLALFWVWQIYILTRSSAFRQDDINLNRKEATQ